MKNWAAHLDQGAAAFGEAQKAVEFPTRITLELTNRCNLNCVMCPRRYMTAPLGFMERSLFTRLIDQISVHAETTLVPFFRGESLLHPQFHALMTYARKRLPGAIQFATNATLLTQARSDEILDLGFDFISFSVDSIDPLTYGSIRQGADLAAVLENIYYFCNAKQRLQLAKPQLQVSVVKKPNDGLEKITKFLEFWQGKVDRVRVYEEHSRDGKFGSLEQTESDPSCKFVRKPCFKPFTDLVVYWNGAVAICNHDWDRKNPIGDLYQTEIATIWRGEFYERLREAHFETAKLNSPCDECDHWKSYYEENSVIGKLYPKGNNLEGTR